MARRTGSEHGDMLWRSDPYVIAWLMYWLRGETDAGTAFFGSSPELASNAYWQEFANRDNGILKIIAGLICRSSWTR